MKIVCGSCQAKYSIADEKVAGKVFKIRCKRCSEVIVVRGDQEGAAAATNNNGHADHEADESGADAIWHVVIHGEQAGPYTPAQLSEFMQSGQLDWEAYVWSEGFDNWRPIREVPQLMAAMSGERGERQAAQSSQDPQSDDDQGGPREHSEQRAREERDIAANSQPMRVAAQPSMGADPFAEEVAAAPMMYAKVAGAQGGGGHTGHAAQPIASRGVISSSSYDPKVPVSAPSPRVSTEQALTGARNENSVLFSLKNLQALATGSSAPATVSSRPGYAGGEGSGLIDIRALATTTGVAEPARNNSEKDALLSLGSAQAGAFGALGSPMLAPAGKTDDDDGKKGLMVAIIGGFALLAAAGVAIAFIMKPAPAAPALIAPVAPAPTAAAVPGAAAPTQPAAAQPSEPPSEGELAARRAEAAAAAQAHDSANDDNSRRSGHGRHEKAGNDKSAAAAAPAAAAKTEEPADKPADKPVKRGGNASIDDLLNDAIGGKNNAAGAKQAAAAAAAANLPEKPSREDVLAAMKGVSDEVKACGKGQTGVAFANVTVAGKTGRVSNVDVTGMTGDVGSCIARTVRKASFPKFKADNFQVKFPFRL